MLVKIIKKKVIKILIQNLINRDRNHKMIFRISKLKEEMNYKLKMKVWKNKLMINWISKVILNQSTLLKIKSKMMRV